MISRNLRSFLDRDWAAVQQAKDAYWSDFARSHGPLEALRIADQLRRQAQQSHAGWPSDDDRAADLEAHRLLSERLRRASGPSRH